MSADGPLPPGGYVTKLVSKRFRSGRAKASLTRSSLRSRARGIRETVA